MPKRAPRPWKSFGLVLLSGGAVVGAWLAFARILVPQLISSAYRNESIAILNNTMKGRDTHAVSHYLDFWHHFSGQLTLGLLAVVVLAAVLVSPVFQGLIDWVAPFGPRTSGEGAATMARGRRRAVVLFIATMAGIQLVAVALHAEIWPFSVYSMYSTEQGSSMAWFRLYGVTESGEEIYLQPETYFRPFDIVRLPYAFEDHILERPDKVEATRRALANCLEIYETGRRAGRHTGPVLKSLRLYKVIWHVEPTAANKNTPDRRELINVYPSGN